MISDEIGRQTETVVNAILATPGPEPRPEVVKGYLPIALDLLESDDADATAQVIASLFNVLPSRRYREFCFALASGLVAEGATILLPTDDSSHEG